MIFIHISAYKTQMGHSNDVKVRCMCAAGRSCSALSTVRGQCVWHMHTSPGQSAYSPRGRYVMTAVCAAARHFHTDGPLAWNNPLIKGFLYYQPSSPIPKPPPPTLPVFFSYTFKGIPPASKGNYSPTEFIQKSPHTHKRTLRDH